MQWLVALLIVLAVGFVGTVMFMVHRSRNDADDMPPMPQPLDTTTAEAPSGPVVIAPEGMVPQDNTPVLPPPAPTTALARDAGSAAQPASTTNKPKPKPRDAGSDADNNTVIVIPTPWPLPTVIPTEIPTTIPLPQWPPKPQR